MKWTCNTCKAINAELATKCHNCGVTNAPDFHIVGSSSATRMNPPDRVLTDNCDPITLPVINSYEITNTGKTPIHVSTHGGQYLHTVEPGETVEFEPVWIRVRKQ